jgi:peptidyl-prolyl cis-trans isomerase D
LIILQKYQEAVLNPQNARAWLGVERYVQQTLPFQKLQELITSSAIVTEEEIKDDYMQKNMEAKIEYLNVPISAFSSEKIEVSEKEIKDYYEKNKEDFKVEEK